MTSGHTPSPPSARGRHSPEARLREALLHVPRSLFCEEEPPKHESEVREPPEDLTVVTMLEGLALVGTERVLELGSPTAYTAALLSHLAAEVYSVAADQDVAERREQELHSLDCRNVHVVLAAPQVGWPVAAPYQAILVGAAASELPLELVHQLDLGGRLVISIGDANAQLLERVHKRQDSVDSETLGACHLSLLPGARQTPSQVPWAPPSRR
jgi:protein-L-isoaspartate(D-aspartate) O-methyltransferase